MKRKPRKLPFSPIASAIGNLVTTAQAHSRHEALRDVLKLYEGHGATVNTFHAALRRLVLASSSNLRTNQRELNAATFEARRVARRVAP